MTREEIYLMCGQQLKDRYGNITGYKRYIPESVINAIIDCAVEEAVERIKDMTFATVDGRTGIPITKTQYVERSGDQE